MTRDDPIHSILSGRKKSRWAVVVCAALLGVYAVLAWTAHLSKSPTYDEPYHAVAAWTHLRYGDFRVDSEDPPLWQLYAAIPNGRPALSADFHSKSWLEIPSRLVTQWYWCVTTLYRTPGNDPAAFIARSQAMMLAAAVALGGLMARWAWRLGGPAAAVVTTAMFAFDPGFLGYGPLVKNDVAFSLAFSFLCFSLWRFGLNASIGWAIAIGVAGAAMVTTKFSGVIAGAVVPTMLLVRAFMPAPWGRFETRRSHFVIAFATIALTSVIGVVGIWAAYGFRYTPTSDPSIRLNTDLLADMATSKEYAAAHAGDAPVDVKASPRSAEVRLIRWVEARRLLPQPWLAGLLYTYQSALVRPGYLLGRLSPTGWWYYFPLAMAMKSPVATIAGALLAGVIGAAMLRKSRRTGARWAALCVFAPIALYMASAMHSSLNIGVRHVLPVWPLLMIGTGVAAAASLRRWRRATVAVCAVLGAGLLAETVHAYPDYVAFFNVAAGGRRGGIAHLGDSNLDWGQDLPTLVRWQREHPDRKLYLAYFGLADPAWYGLKYTPLPGGYQFDGHPAWPSGDCTLAVSATYLQGILVDPQLYATFYARLAHRRPTAVLGGTIYLFDLDAR